ncbi:wsc domain containing protein [Seiridium cupressi]
MKFTLILLPIVATAAAGSQLKQTSEDPVLGTDTIYGCYSSVGELQLNGGNVFNSQGSCATTCRAAGAYVAATQESSCYCGDTYPAASTLVDDSQCDVPCPGYADSACGGTDAFTIINTGVKVEVGNSIGNSSSSQTSTATSSSITSSASGTSTTIAPTGLGSNSTSSTGSYTGATSSPSPTIVGTSGAISQLTLSILNMAAFGLGAVLLI